jgi:hypothetical protein
MRRDNIPNNERLAATSVTSSEDAVEVGGILARGGLDVLASVLLDVVAQNTGLRAEETHGQENKVGREELLRAIDLLHVPTTTGRAGPLNTDGVDALDLAGTIVLELLGHDAVLTGVLAGVLAHLSVTVVNTVDARPLRPGVVVGTLRRRLGKQLEVGNGLGTVTDGSTNAIVTSITTTNDNNVLVLGGEVSSIGELGVEERLGVLVEELHGVVDTLKLATLDGQITGNSCTSSDDDRIGLSTKIGKGRVALLANSHTGLEINAFSSHEVGTALDNALVKLHVGDAVHEQTTKTVGTLVDRDQVTSPVELIGGSKTSWARADNGDLLASADLRRCGDHPAHLEAAVDDSALNALDTNRIFIDTQNTSTFARSRANTASELGEVVS